MVQVQGPSATFRTVAALQKAARILLQAVALSGRTGQALKDEMKAIKSTAEFLAMAHE